MDVDDAGLRKEEAPAKLRERIFQMYISLASNSILIPDIFVAIFSHVHSSSLTIQKQNIECEKIPLA